MTDKTLASIGEEITNAMIGNDVLAIYWQSLVNWLCMDWTRLLMIGKTLVEQIRIISC